MKKNALWFAAVAAGVAAFAFVVNKKKVAACTLDSAQTWIHNAEEHLNKINLKLHSSDSVA